MPNQQVIKRDWIILDKQWKSEPLGMPSFIGKISTFEDMPSHMSCFNTEHFEVVMDRTAYYTFGPGNSTNTESNLNNYPPTDRQLININETIWTYWKVPKYNFSCDSTQQVFCTPISERHFLILIFLILPYPEFSSHSSSFNESLAKEIINTCHLKLSPSSLQAQQAEIQKRPKRDLSKEYPSFKWKYFSYEKDPVNKLEYVYKSKGSPPPTWSNKT